MEPPSTRPPDLDGPTIEIVVADPAWHRLIPKAGTIVRRAAHAAGMEGTIVLSSNRVVRALNGRHRGKNKPTNVLTYEHPARRSYWRWASCVPRRPRRGAVRRTTWRTWWSMARCT